MQEHIACRTYDLTPSELGVVTNIHITDLKTEGSLESLGRVLCPFVHLRELDLDGGHLSGSLPRFLETCFPHLKELDLSFNQALHRKRAASRLKAHPLAAVWYYSRLAGERGVPAELADQAGAEPANGNDPTRLW